MDLIKCRFLGVFCVSAAILLSACGGGSSSPVANNPAPNSPPEPDPVELSVTAIDGYLYNAEVCLDFDDDGMCDTDYVTTNEQGVADFELDTLPDDYVILVSVIAGQTIDMDNPDTTVARSYSLRSLPGGVVASPLTTVYSSLMADSEASESLAEAADQLRELMFVDDDSVAVDSDYLGMEGDNGVVLAIYARALAALLPAEFSALSAAQIEAYFEEIGSFVGSLIRVLAFKDETLEISELRFEQDDSGDLVMIYKEITYVAPPRVEIIFGGGLEQPPLITGDLNLEASVILLEPLQVIEISGTTPINIGAGELTGPIAFTPPELNYSGVTISAGGDSSENAGSSDSSGDLTMVAGNENTITFANDELAVSTLSTDDEVRVRPLGNLAIDGANSEGGVTIGLGPVILSAGTVFDLSESWFISSLGSFSYQWQQLSGESVEISGTETLNATIVVPEAFGTAEFEITITADNSNLQLVVVLAVN